MGAMLDYNLSTGQHAELEEAHRRTHDKREADRLKAILALATGWSPEDVADVLRVDPNTVRNYFKRYRTDGLEGLSQIGEGVGGSPGWLTEKQLVLVDAHLQENLYLSAKAVAHWVKETLGVSYTESGMTAVLHRLGYVYKKPRLIPGQADRGAQEQFLEADDELEKNKSQDDP
uniref:helix-turn-helix domain-containing protein n=1 Tax=Candidatus Thiosymbion oneisti TaxID=589554 RepID=UPI00105F0987